MILSFFFHFCLSYEFAFQKYDLSSLFFLRSALDTYKHDISIDPRLYFYKKFNNHLYGMSIVELIFDNISIICISKDRIRESNGRLKKKMISTCKIVMTL